MLTIEKLFYIFMKVLPRFISRTYPTIQKYSTFVFVLSHIIESKRKIFKVQFLHFVFFHVCLFWFLGMYIS